MLACVSAVQKPKYSWSWSHLSRTRHACSRVPAACGTYSGIRVEHQWFISRSPSLRCHDGSPESPRLAPNLGVNIFPASWWSQPESAGRRARGQWMGHPESFAYRIALICLPSRPSDMLWPKCPACPSSQALSQQVVRDCGAQPPTLHEPQARDAMRKKEVVVWGLCRFPHGATATCDNDHAVGASLLGAD